MDKEYIIFCDESDKTGRYFGAFYGGVLVGSSQYDRITQKLQEKKLSLNMYAEAKWAKTSEQYLDKYKALVDCFFEEVAAGHLKIRIMFTQNAYVPTGLSKEDLELSYYKLYYQFLKHAFGLRYREPVSPAGLRIYLDDLPDTGEKVSRFRGFISALGDSTEFRKAGLSLQDQDIAEVRSHDHVLLQMLDIVLGAMAFRLNDKHKAMPAGQQRRGRKTIAKEKLYKHILARICAIRPHFNPGITTGIRGCRQTYWSDPYRHWCFTQSGAVYEESKTKGYSRKCPTRPTNT